MSRVFDSSQVGANAEVITAPPSAVYSNTPAFTISAWVKPVSGGGGGGGGTALVKRAPGGSWPTFSIFNFTGLNLFTQIASTGGTANSYSVETIPTGVWSNIIQTFDFNGDKLSRIYLNGIECTYLAQFPLPAGALLDNSAVSFLFGNDTVNDGWDGNLAEIAMWNTVLSGAQIAAVVASTTGVGSIQSANLVGYWHLCGTASPEPDASGNGNSGVLSTNPPIQGLDSPGYSCSPSSFSISGSLGIGGAGATIAYTGTSSGTVTANASGDYTISGLVNGTYTITPTLAGKVFIPANLNQTISGGNITGANFVTAAAYYSEPDCRDFGTFPNLAVNVQGTLTYTVPSVDSRVNKPVDSRVSVPQDCRVAPNIPQNSRTPGTFGPGE